MHVWTRDQPRVQHTCTIFLGERVLLSALYVYKYNIEAQCIDTWKRRAADRGALAYTGLSARENRHRALHEIRLAASFSSISLAPLFVFPRALTQKQIVVAQRCVFSVITPSSVSKYIKKKTWTLISKQFKQFKSFHTRGAIKSQWISQLSEYVWRSAHSLGQKLPLMLYLTLLSSSSEMLLPQRLS